MKFCIHSYTYIYLSVLLFLIPLRWLAAWVTAVLFHELCHWIAVKLCGGTVYSLTFGIAGAKMECTPLSNVKQIIAILSGPMGGFLLLLVGKWFPEAALCSWLLSVYNLIPVQPLDGGNFLSLLISPTMYHSTEQIILWLLILFLISSSIFLHLGVLPIMIAAGIWLRNRKIPCKPGRCKVQ